MQSEELFNGFGWRITMDTQELPDGRAKKGVRVHRCDSAHILAFNADGHILMLREYRPFYGEYIWMIPSGKVDKETDVLVAAGRELQEETGFRAKSLVPYCSVNLSDSLSITNHIFIGHDLTPDPLPQDEEELIEVHAMPIAEALEKVLSSPKIHLVSGFALLRYMKESPHN